MTHKIHACECGHGPMSHPLRDGVPQCITCEHEHRQITAQQRAHADRPTINELAQNAGAGGQWDLLESLEANGYVIVHPDDVPGCDVYRIPGISDRGHPDACLGWMKCRDHIFAATEQGGQL